MTLNLTKIKCYSDLNQIPNKLDIKNLFIITNFGQMNHTLGLIKSLSLDKAFLVVLYTKANFYIPQTIHDGLDEDVFEGICFVEIPMFPNRINLKLALYFKKLYSNLIDLIEPSNLYLNSFQYHYSILASIANNKKINIVLVEEGLGTYRLGGLPEEGKIKKLNSSTVKDIASKSISKTHLFKKVYKRYKEAKIFVKEFTHFTTDIYNSSEFQAILLKHFPDKEVKSVLTPYLDFDVSYTSFPKVSNQIFNVKKSYFYFSHDNTSLSEVKKAQNIIDRYGIKSQDYIYLSQQYSIDDNEYVQIIVEELYKLVKDNNARVFVKLHPRKERPKVIENFKLAELESSGKIQVIEESDFRIEGVIKEANVAGVISITSTGLVYTSVINPNCKLYSVSDVLVEKLSKKKNARGIKMINDHTKIIKQFDNIKFL